MSIRGSSGTSRGSHGINGFDGLLMSRKAYMPIYIIQIFAQAGGSQVVLKALAALTNTISDGGRTAL